VRPGERPEFGRQREGQQKVVGGHLFLHLTFQPLLTLMVLAVRAVAMAAGMRHQLLMIAAVHWTCIIGLAWVRQCFIAARGPIVVGRESVPVLRQEVRLEGFNDGAEADHLTCPQVMEKRSIRPLMRSMA
jgi:hypothetical protein